MEGTWVAPTITGLLGVLVVVAGGALTIRNTRNNAREQRAPDVTEAWSETLAARSLMFRFQDWGHEMRGVLKGYARRMAERFGDEAALTETERATLAKEPPEIPAPK